MFVGMVMLQKRPTLQSMFDLQGSFSAAPVQTFETQVEGSMHMLVELSHFSPGSLDFTGGGVVVFTHVRFVSVLTIKAVGKSWQYWDELQVCPTNLVTVELVVEMIAHPELGIVPQLTLGQVLF